VRDAELVEVMKVSQTKDERRHENGASETSSRTQKQGNTSGAEKTFFGNGSLMKSLLVLHGFDKRCEKEALWGSIDEGIDRGNMKGISIARSNCFKVHVPLPCFSRWASQSKDLSEAQGEAIDEPFRR
jgi:hypothetical protein